MLVQYSHDYWLGKYSCHVSTLLMGKAPTGGMSHDVTTGGHIRQVSVFAKFMKLDRNPPQGGVFWNGLWVLTILVCIIC